MRGDSYSNEISEIKKSLPKGGEKLHAAIDRINSLLPENKNLADNCLWCDSDNQPHSPACPLGERYKFIQLIGGVPVLEEAA